MSCGFIAGTVSRTVTSPLDVVKMLVQVASKGGHAGESVAKIWREDGLAGFWRGNVAACVRLGPMSAIKFYANDKLKVIIGQGKNLTGVQRTVSGAVAGMIAQAITYPLDVVRTRITVNPRKYTGIFQTLGTITSEEGIGSLWSGLGPTMLGVIAYDGAQFFAYESLRNFYAENFAKGQPIGAWQNSLIAASASMFSQIPSYPLDVVRKRMMLKDENGKPYYSGMVDALIKTFQREGISGLYRGVTLNLVKVVPMAMVQFTAFEEVKKAFIKYNEKQAATAAAASKKK